MKRIGFLISVLLLAACHSNPYGATDSTLTVNPVSRKATLPTFSLDAPNIIDVTEGDANVTVPIIGHTLTGSPVISWVGLPAFAVWDPTSSSLIINPPLGSATDPQNVTSTTREYNLVAILTESDDNVSVIQQNIVILVHHHAAALVVSGVTSPASVSEGQSFSTLLTIQSSDFPQGPFYPVASSLPAGAQLVATPNPTQFQLNYSPGFATVKGFPNYCLIVSQDLEVSCVKDSISIAVVDPVGESTTYNFELDVYDVRQQPLVTTPTQINFTLPTSNQSSNPLPSPQPSPSPTPAPTPVMSTVTFYVQAEDPNDEVIPQVQVANPPAGSATVTTVTSSPVTATTHNPYVMVRIDWTGDFSSFAGTNQSLTLNTCVYDVSGEYNNCVSQPVSIQFQ